MLCLAAYVYVPMASARRERAQATQCLENLRAVGTALGSYVASNDQQWPFVGKLTSSEWPTLPKILQDEIEPADDIYRCPADTRTLADDDSRRTQFGSNTTWHATEGLSYEWVWPLAYGGRPVGDEKLSKASGEGKGRADQDLMSDFEAFHHWGLNTLYADLAARPPRNSDTIR